MSRNSTNSAATFQIYVQADSRFRLRPDDINKLNVRNQEAT